jgi:hypothetical protein
MPSTRYTRLTSVWAFCALLLTLAGSAAGQERTRTIPSGAAVFIEEMDSDLDGFLRAEFIKQKVPLTVVLTREEAHLVMVGTSGGNEKRSWHEGWLTAEKDHATGNITLIDRATRKMLWAGEAGDRSLWWGNLARGGQRKVASRLVKELKKYVMVSAATALPPPPRLSTEELSSMPGAEGERAASARAEEARGVPADQPPLTNADIVKLAAVGLSEALIIEKIDTTAPDFQLDTDSLVGLKEKGVSDAIIAAMMRRQKGS